MTPTSTSYTISEDSGRSGRTINPSELNLWRIIKINEDGTIEMVSEYVSSTGVYFEGQTGYLNFVGVLNEIASQYENSKYTIGSRIIGYNGQTEYLTDTSKINKSTAPWKYNTKNNDNETLGGGDVMYEEDCNLVKEVLGTLKAITPSGTATTYWLGSRYYIYNSSTDYRMSGRVVDTSSSIDNYRLYGYMIGDIQFISSIRPIVTLKSGLTATGSGTSTDPWVLQ